MKKFKIIEKLTKARVKKGDTVKLLTGKDKGKQGRVLIVDYKSHKVTVEGVNIAKKAIRPSQQSQKGGIIDMAMPVHISNLKIVCPKCGQAVKVSKKIVNNKSVRVCKNKKCNEILDKV